MKVYIDKSGESVSLDFSGSVDELLKQLQINSKTVIVVKDNEIIDQNERLDTDSNIKILSVISGG